jgi:hypothetical protein
LTAIMTTENNGDRASLPQVMGELCDPYQSRPIYPGDKRKEHIDCPGWWPERGTPQSKGIVCSCACHVNDPAGPKTA